MSLPARQGLGRRLLIGGGGTALGLLFLWIALGDLDMTTLWKTLQTARWEPVAVGIAFYWLALALRVIRWQLLLNSIGPVHKQAVAEILICGYALNNLLPARLGEFFRADLAKRRLGFSRTTVLGSIVVERLLDLLAIVACLGIGLWLERPPSLSSTLDRILWQGAALVAVLAASAWALRRWVPRIAALPARAQRVVTDLQRGLATLRAGTLPAVMVLSAAVWSSETTALWWIFAGFKTSLSAGAAMVVMGAASLSTLVPTAPAYLGSYQLVFATLMPVLGQDVAVGLAASLMIQVALFGSVTLTGLLLVAWRAVHNVPTPRFDLVNTDGRQDSGSA